MKVLHTADWHIGHHLHGHDRSVEHEQFLEWLHQLLRERQIDALLVAGDIFDSANPSAASWQLFYRFLARLRSELPHLNVVITGGNHDSPSKLDAPHELLKAFELHMIGAISRSAEGELEVDRLLVPLKDRQGAVQAWCAAVPYLRSADLRLDKVAVEDEAEDRLVAGVRQLYREVIDQAQARRQPGQAVLAMGHAYLRQGQLSELSERKILGGNLHALPLDMFVGADYVALGHLHLAQALAPTIHYSGSPLPLSMAEAGYNHQVLELELTGEQVTLSARHRVPRAVPLLRVPEQAAPLEQVEALLRQLELAPCAPEFRPFLEVNVLLDKPEPRLRERILALVAEKPLRLARIATHYQGERLGLADRLAQQQLGELTPEQVFLLCYQRQFSSAPPAALAEAFEQLLTQIQEQEA